MFVKIQLIAYQFNLFNCLVDNYELTSEYVTIHWLAYVLTSNFFLNKPKSYGIPFISKHKTQTQSVLFRFYIQYVSTLFLVFKQCLCLIS